MKKYILTASLIALVLPSAANADAFNGFYAGVKAGWNQSRSRVSGTGSLAGLSGTEKENAFAGGFQVGYSKTFGDIYTAGELNFDFREKKGVIKSSFTPSADLKLGYKFNNFVPYATVGVAAQKTELNPAALTKESTKFGFRPGAGVMYGISDNVRAGAEYTYTRFESFSTSSGGAGIKVKPRYHSVMAKVSYSF